MTHQPLRDRIAAALYERERPPRDPHWPNVYAMDREVFEAMADAVLPALQPELDTLAALDQPAPAPASAPALWLLAGTRDLSIPTQHTFTARPVDPETERAATERAIQAAADSEKSAAWFAAHSQPTPAAPEATEPPAWAPPPPGGTREQLPDHLLDLIRGGMPDYTSTACVTADALAVAVHWSHPRRAELGQWAARMHARCRLNHKFTGQLCTCGCHETAPAATQATNTQKEN